MILLTLIGLIKGWRGSLETSTGYLKWMVPAISFPYIANFSGWIMSEIGRQPWIVNGLMTTADGISPNVSASSILFSLISFSLIYTLLAIAMAYLFLKIIKQGPFAAAGDENLVTDPFYRGGKRRGA